MELEIQPKIPPVFIFGYERSGTTLLGMMVGAHPSIAVPFSVTGLWFRYGSRLGSYSELQTKESVERMVDDLRNEERIKLWDAQLDRSTLLNGISQGDYPSVVRCFHSCYAAYRNKPFWGNLDIATLDHLDVVNRWFPDAKFVHIIRDCRDVVLSNQTMPYGRGNCLDVASDWEKRVFVNVKMGAVLGPERYFLLRYEDLVEHTERALLELCSFIGVSYSPDMLRYPEMVDEKIPRDKRWLWPDIQRKPRQSNAHRWRTSMSSAQRILVESIAGHVLRETGYETYDRMPKSATAYALEAWHFFTRGHRLRRLAARFGIRRISKLERDWARNGKN